MKIYIVEAVRDYSRILYLTHTYYIVGNKGKNKVQNVGAKRYCHCILPEPFFIWGKMEVSSSPWTQRRATKISTSPLAKSHPRIISPPVEHIIVVFSHWILWTFICRDTVAEYGMLCPTRLSCRRLFPSLSSWSFSPERTCNARLVFTNLSTAEFNLFRQTTSLTGDRVALYSATPLRESSVRIEEPCARERSLCEFCLVNRAVKIASIRYRASLSEMAFAMAIR